MDKECIKTRFISPNTIEAIYNDSLLYNFHFSDSLNVIEQHVQAARTVVENLHLGKYEKDWIRRLINNEHCLHLKL